MDDGAAAGQVPAYAKVCAVSPDVGETDSGGGEVSLIFLLVGRRAGKWTGVAVSGVLGLGWRYLCGYDYACLRDEVTRAGYKGAALGGAIAPTWCPNVVSREKRGNLTQMYGERAMSKRVSAWYVETHVEHSTSMLTISQWLPLDAFYSLDTSSSAQACAAVEGNEEWKLYPPWRISCYMYMYIG